MSAYLIVSYLEAPDPDALAEYAGKAGAVMQGKGAKFIARGAPVKTYEHGKDERAVIIEFESVEVARAAFESDDYQEVAKLLGGTPRDVRLIEGA